MNLPVVAVVAYLLITTSIGLVASRLKGKGGIREFFVASGGLHWTLLVPFLLAEFIASAITIGNSEMAHQSGIQTLWFFIPYPISMALSAFCLAKFFQKIQKVTLGEALGVLFAPRTRLAAVIFLIIAISFSLGMVNVALGALLGPLLNISPTSGAFLSAALQVGLALLGLRGIAWMNIVHLCAIIICFIPATLISVNAVGGLGTLLTSLPAEHLNLFRPGAVTIVAWVISRILYLLVNPLLASAMFAAKDERNAKIGAVSTGIFVLLFSFLPMLIGLSAYIVMPAIPSRLALWKMGEYCGVAVSAMITVGVLGAFVSSMPGFFLSTGALITRDIFLRVKPEASEKAQLTFTRIIIPVIVFSSTYFALFQPSILGLYIKMSQVRSILGFIVLISIIWRRIHSIAAYWYIIFGGGVGMIWFLAGSPFGIEPLWPGLGIGILTLIITSLRYKPSPFKGIEGLELD